MIIRIALVAEIMATLICIYCINGRKFKLNIKTMGLIIGLLTILEIINFYQLGGIWSFVIYIILVSFCICEFKRTVIEAIMSLVLCTVISTAVQFICILLVYGLVKEELYVRNAISNIIALIFFVVVLPRCEIHKLFKSICSKQKFVVILLGFMGMIVLLMLLQGKTFYELQGEYFILVIPAIGLLLYAIVKWHTIFVNAEKMQEEISGLGRSVSAYDELLVKVRLRQHEFKNHLTAIFSTHYTYKTYEKLVQAQEEYCNKLSEENKYNNLLLLGEPVLAGYLYRKFQEAEDDGIKVEYKVSAKMDKIKTPIYYVVEMLGILLDNAMEANKNIMDKRISIDMYECEGVYQILVGNPSRYVLYDEITEWFNYEKSAKGIGRGLGLYHLKCLCEEWKCDIGCKNEMREDENRIVFILTIRKTDSV